MKIIQIIRFVMAEIFAVIAGILFYQAATEESLWSILLSVLGIISTIVAVVAGVLFIQEYKRGFTFLDEIRAQVAEKFGFKYDMKSKQMIMGQPGSGKAYCNKKPVLISDFQDICEQYGNNDGTCYALAPHQYRPCRAEHCPYGSPATDEDFANAGMDPSKNDGNYIVPKYVP